MQIRPLTKTHGDWADQQPMCVAMPDTIRTAIGFAATTPLVHGRARPVIRHAKYLQAAWPRTITTEMWSAAQQINGHENVQRSRKTQGDNAAAAGLQWSNKCSRIADRYHKRGYFCSASELTSPPPKDGGFPFHRTQPMPQRATGLTASARADTASAAASTLRAAFTKVWKSWLSPCPGQSWFCNLAHWGVSAGYP